MVIFNFFTILSYFILAYFRLYEAIVDYFIVGFFGVYIFY